MMIDLSLKIDLSHYKNIAGLFPSRALKAITTALKQSALVFQNQVKRNAPVKTGTLRRSITNEVSYPTAKIGTNLVYAPIHEFGGTIHAKNGKYLRFKGSRGWATVPSVTIRPYKGVGYFRPAIQQTRKKILEIFEKNMKKILT